MAWEAAIAASAFLCLNPVHHDGDAIHCDGNFRSMRLYGIDAAEMPGACRPGRRCTPGDPYQARDHLASLTQGRTVTCYQVAIDHYGRRVVRCAADSVDLSCAMMRDGFAVERYGSLTCDNSAIRPIEPSLLAALSIRKLPYWIWVLGYLVMINAGAYGAFYLDKQRARRRLYRISENSLLMLALLGGSPGSIFAQQQLRHKTQKQPFATILVCILGLQIGICIAMASTWWL